MTVCCWGHGIDESNNFNNLVSRQIGNTGGEVFGLGLTLDRTAYGVVTTVNGAVTVYGPQFGGINDAWMFQALTYDGALGSNNIKLYYNGVLEAQSNLTGNISSTSKQLVFGANNNGAPFTPSEFWYGYIADVRVYNRTLSTDELESIRLSKSRVVDRNGLIGWWPLRDGAHNVSASGQGRPAHDAPSETISYSNITYWEDPLQIRI
jgi:hypothetical protein